MGLKEAVSSLPLLRRCGEYLHRTVSRILSPIQRKLLRWLIKSQYGESQDQEITPILSFLHDNEVTMIPYEFVSTYRSSDITVNFSSDGYPYVNVRDDRVFFPKDMTGRDISSAVNLAMMEQDSKSPHCYNSDYFTFEDEGAAVFVGASDGIYCLSVLEHFRSAYLFEADPRWLIPLELTFAPYSGKVTVIPYFVSDKDACSELTLDSFSQTLKEPITYIQADIEGSEMRLLAGASRLLSSGNRLKLSLCCYHRPNHWMELGGFLKRHGFSVSHSPGYMIMWMQVPLRKPYLRRGVIYAEKTADG